MLGVTKWSSEYHLRLRQNPALAFLLAEPSNCFCVNLFCEVPSRDIFESSVLSTTILGEKCRRLCYVRATEWRAMGKIL